MNFDNWYILKTKNGLIGVGKLETETKQGYEFRLSLGQEDVGIPGTSNVKKGWSENDHIAFHGMGSLNPVFVEKKNKGDVKILREIDDTTPFDKIIKIMSEIRKEEKIKGE